MPYSSLRRLVLAAGLVVLLLVAGVMYVRRVDTVEVAAVLLFVGVFLGFVTWRVPGGLATAAAATGAYAALRSPAVDALGSGRFATLVASRGVGYLAFGLIGGWATAELARSLDKLDVYDQVDDETGLFNARFLVQDTGLEMARAARYKTLFSVCAVDFATSSLAGLSRRRRSALLRELGAKMTESVRSVDRVVHARDGSVHRLAVICPETGPEGARVFVDRLAERLATFLSARGAALAAADVGRRTLTFPGDDEGLASLRSEFEAIDRALHPAEPPPAPS